MDYLKEEIVDFLQEISPFLKETLASTNKTVQSSLEQQEIAAGLTEVIGWARELVENGKSYEVGFLSLNCIGMYLYLLF